MCALISIGMAEEAAKPGEADELADLPGRPVGPGEIDPELLKLSKPRTRVGWLLSLSVVVFCAYWMIQLRSDLAFSRQANEPVSVEADQVTGLESDSYVTLRSKPDRARVARVHYGADIGSHVAPVLGSDGGLWLLTGASAFGRGELGSDVYAGRVKRLDEMPFYDSVREFFAARPVFEPLRAETALQALATGASKIDTAHADTLHLEPGTAVEVVHRVDGVARIVATASPDGRSDELSWRNALVRAGVLQRDTPPITGTATSWTYEVPAPEGLEAIERTLEENRLSGAAVIPVETVHTSSWGELAARGADLIVGERAMPLAEVTTVAVAYRPPVRGDAVVVVATERPDDYWYILWLYALFAAFLLLFGWSLVRSIRGSLPPTPEPA